MMDRESEINAFKRLNLSLIASAHGYEIVRKKSTRHSVLMSSGSDKIIVSQNGQHYVYCSVHDPSSSGTVIDFAQKVIEPGCSLGRVRQLLRPFLGSGYLTNLQKAQKGRYATEIKPSELDLAAVTARYSAFPPIAQIHPYLCNERAIPLDILVGPRLHERIRHCPRRGSIIFPHYGFLTGTEGNERCLTGYEVKGPATNMFSKGGRKGLWTSAGSGQDRKLAIAESGLDAISYLALHKNEPVRVASISGQLNPDQPALIRAEIERMEEGAAIVAAFDNDRAGDELTQKLSDLVSATGRSDLMFKEDRPQVRGSDWNKVLMDEGLKTGRIQSLTQQFGR